MKELACLLSILILLCIPLYSQGPPQEGEDTGVLVSDPTTGEPRLPSSSFQWVELPFSSSLTGSGAGGLLEGEATSEGYFRLSYMPEIHLNRFSAQFDLKLSGQLSLDPFDIHFNFDDWMAPGRAGESAGQYSLTLLRHYSRFIRSMQFGQRYEPFYARYGKLMGITLGDGALINGFFDQGVALRSSRPGFEVMIDLSPFAMPNGGIHIITNDLFDPTLVAWRFFARPLAKVPQAVNLSKVEIGLSWAYSPPASGEVPVHRHQFYAVDSSYPIYEWEFLNLNLFGNIIAEATDGAFFAPALGWRWGIWGHTKSIFVFNASITNTIRGDFHSEYFTSDFEKRSEEETHALILPLGTSRLAATLILNVNRYGVYLRSKMAGHLTDGTYHDYQFITSIHIDKRLFNIVSLDFTYEKLYPTTTGERFFEGLQTLRNVVLSASAVVKAKPYTVDLGLNATFDDQGRATYKLSTAVRVTIL